MDESFGENVIDITQWERAHWKAVAFGLDPTIMVLLFEDVRAGELIFRDLHQRFGPIDRFNEIRVAIVEGDIPGLFPGYSVTIGPNLDGMADRARAEGRTIDTASGFDIVRVCRMNPTPESRNLDEFKKAFAVVPRYGLLWGHISLSDGKAEISRDYPIGKQDVTFRNVKDIWPGDIDAAVFPDTRPEQIH